MISVCYIIDMADTLRYLLVGSGEITLENIEVMTYFMLSTVPPVANIQTYWGVMLYDAHVHLFFLQLMSRSPSEVYEILSLARLAFCTLWGWDISSLFFSLSPLIPVPSFFPLLLSFLPPPSLIPFLSLLSLLFPSLSSHSEMMPPLPKDGEWSCTHWVLYICNEVSKFSLDISVNSVWISQ